MKKIILVGMICLLFGFTYADASDNSVGDGGGSVVSSIPINNLIDVDEPVAIIDENIIDAGDGCTKYYICSDGSQVEKCGYSSSSSSSGASATGGGGGCGCKSNPEELCVVAIDTENVQQQVQTRVRELAQSEAANAIKTQVKEQFKAQLQSIDREQLMSQIRETAEEKGVKIMPDSASEKAIEALGTVFDTIELVEPQNVGEAHKYVVQAHRSGKFLGIVPVDLNLEAEVDAETGTVQVTKRPWWSFLAFGQQEKISDNVSE